MKTNTQTSGPESVLRKKHISNDSGKNMCKLKSRSNHALFVPSPEHDIYVPVIHTFWNRSLCYPLSSIHFNL